MSPRGKMCYYPCFYPYLYNRKNVPPITMLVSALGNAPPNKHRKMLGVHLYPLVEQLARREHTAKVTGMLLEMETTEVLHLLESPDDLKLMVAETMDVLRDGREDAAMQQMPITALPSALANAPPHRHRKMLGENLYPLVDKLEHHLADMVTEMILEMDTTEVLYLLDSPVALRFMVANRLDALTFIRKYKAPSEN